MFFARSKVGVGGYSAVFNETIEIEKWILIKVGTKINISVQDFYYFTRGNIVDIAKVCEILGCSKQT